MGGEGDRTESRPFTDKTRPVGGDDRYRTESRPFNDKTRPVGGESRSFNDRTRLMDGEPDQKGNRCRQFVSDLLSFFAVVVTLSSLFWGTVLGIVSIVGLGWGAKDSVLLINVVTISLTIPVIFVIFMTWFDVWFNFYGFWVACRRLLTCNYGYNSRESQR